MLLPPAFFDHIPEERGREYEQRLQPRENFYYRVSEDIQGTFEIVDDVEVCIEVPHPLGDATFGVIDLKDPEFAAQVREAFADRWAEAREIEATID